MLTGGSGSLVPRLFLARKEEMSLGTRLWKWFRPGLTHALVIAFLLVSDVSARVRAFLRLCAHKLHVIGAAYDNNRDTWVYLFS